MATQRVTPTTPLILRNRRSVGQFKVCTLCGALNVKENDECFVCRWSGEFNHEGLAVRLKIHEIVRECPELVEAVLPSSRPSRMRAAWLRLRAWWARLTSRRARKGRLDTRV